MAPCRLLTPVEEVINGLMRAKELDYQLIVRLIPGKGRGVVTNETIKKGRFMCEYKTWLPPYPRKDWPRYEEMYRYNKEGCYVFQQQEPKTGKWLCFDGTRRFGSYGRYINHSRAQPNLKPSTPVLVRGKLRVGFLSLRRINPGEELLWDYGC